MPADDSVVLYRLEELSKRIDAEKAEARAERAELVRHMDERFDRMDTRINALTFVPLGTYEAQREAAKEYSMETRRIAIQARTVAMAVLTLLVGAVLALVKVAA